VRPVVIKVAELGEPIDGVAEARLLLALQLPGDSGPVYARGYGPSGRRIVGVWSAPWLAVERDGAAGPFGRAWKLGPAQTPGMLAWDDLPKATLSWSAGCDVSGQGGRGGIRTPETGVARLPVFKTGAFNRSATLPRKSTDATRSRGTPGRL
jgi:hypothetical protein